MAKKGHKVFGLIFKFFVKKNPKEQIISNIKESLDTNHDGQITIEDFVDGKWKDINWVKLGITIIMLIGAIYFGIINLEWFASLLQYAG